MIFQRPMYDLHLNLQAKPVSQETAHESMQIVSQSDQYGQYVRFLLRYPAAAPANTSTRDTRAKDIVSHSYYHSERIIWNWLVISTNTIITAHHNFSHVFFFFTWRDPTHRSAPLRSVGGHANHAWRNSLVVVDNGLIDM